MCVCLFSVIYCFPLKVVESRSSEFGIDQAYFTDWMTFTISNIMDKISFNPDALNTNT